MGIIVNTVNNFDNHIGGCQNRLYKGIGGNGG